MFFITQGSVRKKVTQAVRPMLRVIQQIDDLPKGFWHDVPTIGFLQGCIQALVAELSNKKYEGSTAAQISMGVLDDLAGTGEGVRIAKSTLVAMGSDAFKEAFQAGLLSVMIARYGPEKVKDDPIVKRAMDYAERSRQVSEALSGPMVPSALVSSALQTLYFYDRVDALRHEAGGDP